MCAELYRNTYTLKSFRGVVATVAAHESRGPVFEHRTGKPVRETGYIDICNLINSATAVGGSGRLELWVMTGVGGGKTVRV